MEKQNLIKEAPVMVFNDGLVYVAGKYDPIKSFLCKNNAQSCTTFHTTVFYRTLFEHNIVASHREFTSLIKVKQILDKNLSSEDMANLCLDILVDELHNDPAKDWYASKTFVLGPRRQESIIDYFKKAKDHYVDVNCLHIENLAVVKKL